MGNHFNFREIASVYKMYHLNRTNINYHFLCVPQIMWSLFVLASKLEFKFGDYLVDGEKILLGTSVPYWFILDW